MSRRRLRAAQGLTLCAATVGMMTLPTSVSSAARSFTVKDEGYLRLIKSSGSVLTDEGPAHGTIPGKVRVRFVYNGSPSVSAQITIYGHAGNIQAHANGRLSNPTSPSPSFEGTLTITGGSGRYLHASGSGHIYGVFYRRSYAMTVQTRGALHY
jgi:hypothetical protein